MNYGFAVLVAFCCFAMVLSARVRRTTTRPSIHPPCRYDRDCRRVRCTRRGEIPECHRAASSPTGAECHCHIPNECKYNADYMNECGPNATCDDRACHGDCIHD